MLIQAYSPGQFADSLIAAGANLAKGIPVELQRPLAMLFQADVRRQFYAGVTAAGVPFQKLRFPRPAGGDKPLLNTGILANSYVAEADTKAIEVASRHPGAALQQAGGVVKPIRAKALAIPLTVEATRYGSPRRFPRKLFTFPGGGGLYERVGQGKNARIVKHYLFTKQTKHDPRPVGFSDKAIGEASEMLLDYWIEKG